MIETKVNYALVGGFVLVLGAVSIAVFLWLASGGASRSERDLYLAVEDESVAGLNVNAPVKYNGVDVGNVQEIHLDPDNPERVRLIFAIDHGTPINVDTVAVLKTQGLTGIAYVELSGGERGAAPLLATVQGEYPVIRTKPSLSARLENVLSSVLAKLDDTSGNINSLLSDENREAFSSALADIAAVSRTIDARKDTLDAGIASAARTLSNGERATEYLGPVIESVGRSAAAVERLANEATVSAATAKSTFESVGLDVNRLTTESLPRLEFLLDELGVLSASLRRLSEQTERNPAGFLFGRSNVEPGPGESSP